MTSALTWEEQTRVRIDRVRGQKQRAQELLDYWTQRLSALEKALELEAQESLILQNGKAEISHAELRTMSVNDACKWIAQQNSGFLMTRDAAKILVKAGVFRSTKDARENIYTTIRRSSDFRWVRRGVHRLLHPDEVTERPPPASRATMNQGSKSRLVDSIAAILQVHPDWTRQQVRDYHIQLGWDFGASKPTYAVSGAFAALARRGRRKEKPAVQAPLPAAS